MKPHDILTRWPKLIVALLHGRLLGDVEAVQELSNILVLDGGRLLDEGRRLRDSLQRVAVDDLVSVEDS